MSTLAFIHPKCGAGGGGERVLWEGLSEIVSREKFARVVVYASRDQGSLDAVLDKVQQQFGVAIKQQLDTSSTELLLIDICSDWLLEGSRYPVATLLLQSLMCAFVCAECLWRTPLRQWPNVWVDTVGLPLSYPLFAFVCWLLSALRCLPASARRPQVACYVHYPLISTDMIQRVQNDHISYNNRAIFAKSAIARFLKLNYYKLIAYCYGLCSHCVDVCMVNSTWTAAHIDSLWFGLGQRAKARIVYPPCGSVETGVRHIDAANGDTVDIDKKEATVLSTSACKRREPLILSVGQFRPEKDHILQVRAFSKLLQSLKRKPLDAWDSARFGQLPKLVLAGGVRNDGDRLRVAALRALIAELRLEHCVQIAANVSRTELDALFERAFVGVHTMRDEHFGICVVEYMMHGIVAVAHRSGGPLTDIIRDSTQGFLCQSEEEYATALYQCLQAFDDGKGFLKLRRKALKHVSQQFSSKSFQKSFADAICSLAE